MCLEMVELSESFQVAVIIEKLLPSWKEFKKYLKYKRKEMKLEELIVRLRIEEDNHATEKKFMNTSTISKANVVEHAKPNNKKCKHEGEGSNQGSNGGDFQRFK